MSRTIDAADSDAGAPPTRWRIGAVLRWLGTFALLGGVFYFVDIGDVAARLADLEAKWVWTAVALSVPFYLLLGLRWAFTAGRVGAPLGYGRAVSECYLVMFINQVLPIGLVGAAAAAVRHHDRLNRSGEAVGFGLCLRAIILDRISNQLALALLMAVSATAWLLRGHTWVAPIGFGLALVWTVATALAIFLSSRPGQGALVRFSRDGVRALITGGALLFHLTVSSAIIACLVGMFYCAGRAIGVEMDFVAVLQVVPLILGSTLIPLGFAGWGVREATAGALYGLLAIGASTGVAVSVTYGLISLATAAPGLAVLLWPSAVRLARTRPTPRLFYSLCLIAGAGLSAALGDAVYVSAAGLAALGISIVRGRRAWTPGGVFGIANAITSIRVAITAALWLLLGHDSMPIFIGVLVLVFALDGLDGYFARRLQTASAFGESFDKRADAYFVLVLSVLLVTHGLVGIWVMVGGLAHYVYELVVSVFPARGIVPRSPFGRAVYVILVASLILPFVFPMVATPIAAIGTVFISLSYSHSFYWTYFRKLPPESH